MSLSKDFLGKYFFPCSSSQIHKCSNFVHPVDTQLEASRQLGFKISYWKFLKPISINTLGERLTLMNTQCRLKAK